VAAGAAPTGSVAGGWVASAVIAEVYDADRRGDAPTA
jgi:hypothetical protein